ncbi:MAG: PAS domain S-box protein [Mariprofundaceae bacterium]|nr:PAS domain S-box protein [Mariprofundaceae bacterium]
MRQLAFNQNYSLRINGTGQYEEINSLQDGFNAMAEKIQQSFMFIEDQKGTLIEQEERFRLLVERIPLPVAVTRRDDGKVLFANREAISFFQIQSKDLGDLSSLMVITQEMRNRILSDISQHGFLNNYEIEATKRDGSKVTMLLSSQPIDYAGEDSLLNVMMDVSERKRIQQRLAEHNELLEREVEARTNELTLARNTADTASADKTRFLASASHDLRQPMQAMSLYI